MPSDGSTKVRMASRLKLCSRLYSVRASVGMALRDFVSPVAEERGHLRDCAGTVGWEPPPLSLAIDKPALFPPKFVPFVAGFCTSLKNYWANPADKR